MVSVGSALCFCGHGLAGLGGTPEPFKEVFTHYRHKLVVRDVTDELQAFPESAVVFLWGDGFLRHSNEGAYALSRAVTRASKSALLVSSCSMRSIASCSALTAFM